MDAAQRGQNDINSQLPRDFESNRAATAHATRTASVQQNNSTSASNSSLSVKPRCFFVRRCAHQNIHAILDHNSTYNFKYRHTSSKFILSCSIQQYSSEQIGTPDHDAPPFQLATAPGFQVNKHPEGEPCTCMVYHITAPTHHTPGSGVHTHDQRSAQRPAPAVLARVGLVGLEGVLEHVVGARHRLLAGALPRLAFKFFFRGGDRGDRKQTKKKKT